MSVHFIIGRAGSGKTRRCADAILASLKQDPLGPPIYWIVPKQATFMIERQLACGSGIDGFCRVCIVSFELLGEEVLAECGGGAVPQVTSAGRQMMLGHLIRGLADRLQFFKSVAAQAGLPAELDATFGEFERSGKGIDDLRALVTDLKTGAADDPQSKSLLAKFTDLQLIYEAYCKYLGQERLDPHRRLAQVLSCIEKCKSVQSADVYVDGFLEFTDFERRTLASLAKVCRQIEITLLFDPESVIIGNPHLLPDDLSLFHRTERAYRQLWFTFNELGISVEAPTILRETRRFKEESLGHAERHLFVRKPDPMLESAGIEMAFAPNRRAEVDAAARMIRQWMLEGFRLRDITVTTRSLENYAELIDASFREHQIPCFIDRRRPAAHHPLPQLVRSIALLALHDWPHEVMISILKSGLCDISLEEADELENYVLLHRIRGEKWASAEPWKFQRKMTRNSESNLDAAEQFKLDRINQLRQKIVDPLRPFVEQFSANLKFQIRDYVIALFKVLEACGVRATMLQWIKNSDNAGQLEQRDEHEQVWAELIKLLDQMTDVMGDEQVSPADFLGILESGLERFDLALTPETVDQVLVGQIDRTRTPDARAMIVLGLNEGEFPQVPRDATILSDAERAALKARKIEIDPDSQRRLLDENLLGYIAFTRASERLYISRPAADGEGRAQLPSPFWRRVETTFPNVIHSEIPPDDCSADTIGTPRQLVTRLMRWVRQTTPSPGIPGEGRGENSSVENAAWLSLYHWLAGHESHGDAVNVMRQRAWRALSYDNQANLSPEIAGQMFASPLRASVSRIEAFATCPFQHFARYGLELRPREDAEVTSLDLGNIYHGILEKIVKEMVRARKTWNSDPLDMTDLAIKDYAAQIGESLRGELMLSSARNQYLLKHIEKTLGEVIAAQGAVASRGRFQPLRAELEFGSSRAESLPAFNLRTPKQNLLELRGKIDRVDLVENGAAFAVIDYKLSGNSLSLDRVYHGISLQLLTYLLVLQANGQSLAGRKLTPAAAFYVKLLRQLEDVKHPKDATAPDDEAFHLQTKPRGVIDRKYLKLVDAELDFGESKIVQAMIKKDGAIGRRNNSDLAESNEFAALLRHVRKRIGALGDQIIEGRIDIAPYRMGQLTPCPNCDFHSVCRFDVMTNRYHHLSILGRVGVLEQLTQEADDGD